MDKSSFFTLFDMATISRKLCCFQNLTTKNGLGEKLIRDSFQRKIVFGKLYFTVAPFLSNSNKIGDTTFSGIVVICNYT
jgi:hypothetical protein